MQPELTQCYIPIVRSLRAASRIVFWLALPCCAAAQHINLEHAGRLVSIANPQISPDGKSVVVSVTRANFRNNLFETQMVRVDVATKGQTVLTSRNARQHQFSPDGRSHAFLSPVEGRPQIFILPVSGGPERQVSRSATGVSQYAWWPDSQAIAFVSQEEPPKVTGDERHNLAFEADVGYTRSKFTRSSHLWLVASGGGEAKRLTSGDWSVGPEDDLHWLPDGKRIVFSHYPGASDRLLRVPSISALELQSGVVTPWRESFGRNQFLGFSPGGRHLLYRKQDGLWTSLVAGDQDTKITNGLDLTMTAARWTPNGKSINFRGLRGPQPSLWVQPLDGPARGLLLGNPTRSFHLAPNGNLAVVGSECHHPAELYFLKTLESSPERLTDFNAPIRALDLGKQEPFEWRSLTITTASASS